ALGDTCANPYVVGALPFSASSTTVGANHDYSHAAGSCLPETSGTGNGANDEVYAFTPTTSGKYVIKLTGSNFDSSLYVTTDCANIDASCVAGDDDICENCTELVAIDATAGTTYYVIVDGWGSSATPGPYMLEIEPAPPGDTCSDAITISSLPYAHTGETSSA